MASGANPLGHPMTGARVALRGIYDAKAQKTPLHLLQNKQSSPKLRLTRRSYCAVSGSVLAGDPGSILVGVEDLNPRSIKMTPVTRSTQCPMALNFSLMRFPDKQKAIKLNHTKVSIKIIIP